MSVTIHPVGDLGFNRPFNHNVKRTLTLSNYHAQPVTFKVKTTAPRCYCVRPNMGRIEPAETVEVQVMLMAMREEPPLSARCKDKFLIQSMLITLEDDMISPYDIWRRTNSDADINSQKIRVVYLPPEMQTVVEENSTDAMSEWDESRNLLPSLSDVDNASRTHAVRQAFLSKWYHSTPPLTNITSGKRKVNVKFNEPPSSVSTSEPHTKENGPSETPVQILGWNQITLPDDTAYFVHSGMRIITDIDLRVSAKLEAVTTYLQLSNSVEEALLPDGWELWLIDPGITKDAFTPVRSWVNHTQKTLHDSPPDRQPKNGPEAGAADPLDLEYRYWAFMESHPAHAPLPRDARTDALNALTWSYTDCLAQSTRPVLAPFTQVECQELLKLLHSLGSSDDSETQQVTHTRLVSLVLMRFAKRRQHDTKPDKPMLGTPNKEVVSKEVNKEVSHSPVHKTPYRKSARGFLMAVMSILPK